MLFVTMTILRSVFGAMGRYFGVAEQDHVHQFHDATLKVPGSLRTQQGMCTRCSLSFSGQPASSGGSASASEKGKF